MNTKDIIEQEVERLGNDMSWINKPNYKDYIRQSLTRVVEKDTQAEKLVEKTLRNVPVGFVRQWINEDLLKDRHKLVTNDDIQAFINVAINSKEVIAKIGERDKELYKKLGST